MAKMNLEARQAHAPDHRSADLHRATLVVSVTYDTGKPVIDLNPADIVVRAIAAGASAPEVTLLRFEAPGEGIYVLELDAAWPAQLVLAVSAARGFDRGQCLTEVTRG